MEKRNRVHGEFNVTESGLNILKEFVNQHPELNAWIKLESDCMDTESINNVENNLRKGYAILEPESLDYWPESFKTGEILERDKIHYFQNLNDAFRFYPLGPVFKVVEVEALGIVTKSGTMCITNKLRVIRELLWDEVGNQINIGRNNSGLGNTGHENCGFKNSGSNNNGDENVGNYNRGNKNVGCCNCGNRNIGDHNMGHNNIGCGNTGSNNIGDYNLASNQTGCFNTTEEKRIRMFNKPSTMSMSEWKKCFQYRILRDMPFGIIRISNDRLGDINMTNEEKKDYPEYQEEYKKNGYYWRKATKKDRQRWWDSLYADDKASIFWLPGFDPDTFEKCTGIDCMKGIKKEIN